MSGNPRNPVIAPFFKPYLYILVLLFQEHLMHYIVRQKGFWAADDDSVLRAIREGFIQTHQAMWKELGTFIDCHKNSRLA